MKVLGVNYQYHITKSLTDAVLYHSLRERLDKLGRKLNLFTQSVDRGHLSER